MRTFMQGPRPIRLARIPDDAYRLWLGPIRCPDALPVCRCSQNVRVQGTVRLEAEFSMETEPVVGDMRDPYAVSGGSGHAQRNERHRGADPLLPEFRDHSHVDARDAAAEEEGGRGDRLSFPPPEVIPDRGVWSEPDAAEVIEEPADRRLGQFVSDRQGGKPDPQRLLVPDRVDG